MSFYTYQAETVLHRLSPKNQLAIEYLRKHKLMQFIRSGLAHVHNNQNSPVEYYTLIPPLDVKLLYFEQYTPPYEIVIFQIDYPIKPNGHKKHP